MSKLKQLRHLSVDLETVLPVFYCDFLLTLDPVQAETVVSILLNKYYKHDSFQKLFEYQFKCIEPVNNTQLDTNYTLQIAAELDNYIHSISTFLNDPLIL